MWNTFETLPEVGRKFIALFDDGSGSEMFFRTEDDAINESGHEYGLDFHNFSHWSYLPDGFKFWCESHGRPLAA